MGMQISLQDSNSLSLGYIPRSGIARSYNSSSFILFFNFLGVYILFFTVSAPIYILTNTVQGFSSLLVLTNTLFPVSIFFLSYRE